MPRKTSRVLAALFVFASGAVMLTSPNFACESFLGETVMSGLDMCFIFDCNSGIFGGTVQPCAGGTDGENNLFVDCPTNAP